MPDFSQVVNYSLTPDRRRFVHDEIAAKGGATPKEMKAIAQREGCALKAIHQLMENSKLTVKPETKGGAKSFAELPKLVEDSMRIDAKFQKDRHRLRVFLPDRDYRRLTKATNFEKFIFDFSDGVVFFKPHSDGIAGSKYGNNTHVFDVTVREPYFNEFDRLNVADAEIDERGLRLLMPERCIAATAPQPPAGTTTQPAAPEASGGGAQASSGGNGQHPLAAAVAKVNSLLDENTELYLEDGKLRARVIMVMEF